MKLRLAGNRPANWALFDRFEVPDYDRPDRNYLTRWRLIVTPWFGVFLHRFDGPDPRPTLHDHPWNFHSLVLRGGYVEATEYSELELDLIPLGADPTWPAETLRKHGVWNTWPTGTVNHKRATDAHTIVHLLRVPTWTLMFVGRRSRTWGYINRDGIWTQFDQHFHSIEFDNAMARRKATA